MTSLQCYRYLRNGLSTYLNISFQSRHLSAELWNNRSVIKAMQSSTWRNPCEGGRKELASSILRWLKRRPRSKTNHILDTEEGVEGKERLQRQRSIHPLMNPVQMYSTIFQLALSPSLLKLCPPPACQARNLHCSQCCPFFPTTTTVYPCPRRQPNVLLIARSCMLSCHHPLCRRQRRNRSEIDACLCQKMMNPVIVKCTCTNEKLSTTFLNSFVWWMRRKVFVEWETAESSTLCLCLPCTAGTHR